MFVTYDGSGKAAGVTIYMNGEPQPTDTAADSLRETIKTTVPLQGRPAAHRLAARPRSHSHRAALSIALYGWRR